MGLNSKDEGVLSHVLDLAVGALAAFAAWGIYTRTGQTSWSLMLLIVVALAMIWWRTRGGTDTSSSE